MTFPLFEAFPRSRIYPLYYVYKLSAPFVVSSLKYNNFRIENFQRRFSKCMHYLFAIVWNFPLEFVSQKSVANLIKWHSNCPNENILWISHDLILQYIQKNICEQKITVIYSTWSIEWLRAKSTDRTVNSRFNAIVNFRDRVKRCPLCEIARIKWISEDECSGAFIVVCSLHRGIC